MIENFLTIIEKIDCPIEKTFPEKKEEKMEKIKEFGKKCFILGYKAGYIYKLAQEK